MDEQNERQELDLDDILDDILKEFGTEEEAPASEERPAPEEAPAVEEAPEAEETPEMGETPETGEEPAAQMPPLEVEPTTKEPTQRFEAVEEGAPADLEAVLAEDTIKIMEDIAAVLAEEPQAAADGEEAKAEEAQPAPVEPAFEIEEEFIPAPTLFTPRSRLKELKKQLVAGPEKRYYELSELGIGKLQMALLVSLVVVCICAAVTTMYALDMIPENRLRLVIFSQVLAMLVSALMGSGLMVDAVADLFKGRFTLNTLLTISFGVCLADSVLCLMAERIPCCAAFSLEMTMALWARLEKHNTEMAQMDTLRKAVRLHGIIKADDYFEGQDGLLRVEGEVADFMDVYNKPTSPEFGQSVYAALSLLACVGIAAFAGMLHGLDLAVQILSTSLLVAVPATFFISQTRPMAVLETRLHMVGTVLCGWDGVRDLCGKAAFPLADSDLFPQGSTKLNGVKFYTDRNPDDVVSSSGSLIIAAGGGLVSVFRQMMKSRSCQEQKVTDLRNYGDGGIGAMVGGEPVLMGTLEFMQDMGVAIPEGTAVSQAVYAAIDGQLCAVYAISYARMRSAAAGLVSLCGYRKLTMLKMPGDFMLTEEFLHNKFNVKTKRIRFLDWETADRLKAFRPDPSEPVLAMTTREELVSAAYAVTGARALRQASRLGMGIHLIGGILGLIIMLILGYLGSVELLTPTNVLLYQLIWCVPGLLVTEWTKTV